MGAIDVATVRWSDVGLRPRRTQTETAAPIAPSSFAPSSSTGAMTLEAIMAQLVHMDAYLDTFSDALC